MKKSNLLIFIVASILLGAAPEDLEYRGIGVLHHFGDGSKKRFTIKREVDAACKKLPITNEVFWKHHYADPNVPAPCRATFAVGKGKLLPMRIDPDIETVGVLETLLFIKRSIKSDRYLLIDARGEEWFDFQTIPSAINIPFHVLREPKAYPFAFERAIKVLGGEIDNRGRIDFRGGKEILVFCNGPWCTQSVIFIEALLDLGFESENIHWFRGGMEEWLLAPMTTTRDKKINTKNNITK